MFVNISNHPCDIWQKEQYDAASKYGEIKDFGFPVTSGSMSQEEVLYAAKNSLADVKNMSPDAVLCVGEFSFVYAFVSAFLNTNIPIFSTMSENKLEQLDSNGIYSKKMINYKFKSFINYSEYEEVNTKIIKNYNDVILNCSSNYPKKTFDDKCIIACSKYASEIIDYPISPIVDFDYEQRLELIEKYLNDINNICPRAIILDGEFHTFFAMASILRRCGYTILVKCSNRCSSETVNNDGTITKIAKYKFIQFRELAIV